MAAEYMRQRAARSGLGDLIVESAGLIGLQDEPASQTAIAVMQEQGLDLSAHRSSGVAAAGIRSTDLLVAMTIDQLEELEQRFPQGGARRLLIRAFENQPSPEGGAPDLEDPIGESIGFYRDCLNVIRRCVDHLVLHLAQRP